MSTDVKQCCQCKTARPLDEFYRNGKNGKSHSWCKRCCNLARVLAAQHPCAKAKKREYDRSEKYLAYKREYNRSDRGKATQRRWMSTLRGRLSRNRQMAKFRLKRARTEAQRQRLLALIASYDREIERLRTKGVSR